MSKPIRVEPLHPIFAAEIIGADLTEPPEQALVRLVEDAMARYAVTVVRGAHISDDEHIRFSRAFGPLELPPSRLAGAAKRRLRSELFDASNLDAEGRVTTDAMRATMPPVTHPLVRTMPYGRKALYIGGHATGIVGWPEQEALELLDELYAFATHERFIYAHKWRQDDLVIWDNRCALHRATPFELDEYVRDMRRTTINESGPETSADAAA